MQHLGRAAPVAPRPFEPFRRAPWEVDPAKPWEGEIRPKPDFPKEPEPPMPEYLHPERFPDLRPREPAAVVRPEPPEAAPTAPGPRTPPSEPEPAAPELPAPEGPEEELQPSAPGAAPGGSKALVKSIKAIRRAKQQAATHDRPARMGRAVYSAWETHGSFGLIDAGETRQGCRLVTLHVPPFSHGYTLDFAPGDEIYATSIGSQTRAGRLDVHFVTRNKYYAPGTRVTSCIVGVPEEQWERLMGPGSRNVY